MFQTPILILNPFKSAQRVSCLLFQGKKGREDGREGGGEREKAERNELDGKTQLQTTLSKHGSVSVYPWIKHLFPRHTNFFLSPGYRLIML